MRNTLETRLGIFFALCFIVAVIILEMVGVAEYFKPGYRLYADFKAVQDLKPGDLVKMAGVEVGRVEKIELTNEVVRVTMKIKKRDALIKTDSKATIKFTGLMGQNYVSIDFGRTRSWHVAPDDFRDFPALLRELSGGSNVLSVYLWGQFPATTRFALTNATLPQTDKQALLAHTLDPVLLGNSIFDPQRFEQVPLSEKTIALKAQNPRGDDLARLNRFLLQDAYPELVKYQGPSIKAEDGAILSTTEQTDLSSLLTKLETVAGEVQVLRKDLSTENIAKLLGPVTDVIEQSSNHLNVILTNVRKVSEQVAEGRGTVGHLLYDDTLYNSALTAVAGVQAGATELKAITLDVRSLLNDVNAGKGNLGLLVKDDALYRETTNAMTNVREIMQKVNKGDGTVGKLINDDSFYKNAKVSLQKLDTAAEGLEDQGPLTVLGLVIGKLF